MSNQDELLCRQCSLYVVCPDKQLSFCIAEPLYTHTEKKINEHCSNLIEGRPMTQKQFENCEDC